MLEIESGRELRRVVPPSLWICLLVLIMYDCLCQVLVIILFLQP